MNNKGVDNKDALLVMALQDGIPITSRPYKNIAERLGISEDEVTFRLRKLKKIGLIKRVDLRVNLKKIGLASTLVACKINRKKILKAKDIIANCKNATHNYLRKHNLNMWFTLSAESPDALSKLLAKLRQELNTDKLLNFQTKKIFKLEFRLNIWP